MRDTWLDVQAGVMARDPVVDALAQQVPHYEPGSQHGYHATTYGWLVGEVVRRVAGRSVGTYFHDEIATPLGLDLLRRMGDYVGALVRDHTRQSASADDPGVIAATSAAQFSHVEA